MEREYRDRHGARMSRQEVQLLAPEQLAARSGLPLKIMRDLESLYDAIAEVMIDTIVRCGGRKTTMILPVGPIAQYPVFAKKVKERRLDCRNLWTFNMDEFVDRTGRTIPQSHPMSFMGTMRELFFDKLPADLRMPWEQMFFPNCSRLDEMNRAFEEHAPSGVDLCLAGVGPEGHFAFNEDPNFRQVEVSEEEFLADRTRLVLVNASTVDMDALVASCGDRAAIPPFAVTIGPHDVLRAKRTEVIFFAGKFQRQALRETLFRVPTMRFPGSLLKMRKQPDGKLVPQNITVWATPVEAGPVTTQTIG
jgi:glucosamine-6-phosphate deaminase